MLKGFASSGYIPNGYVANGYITNGDTKGVSNGVTNGYSNEVANGYSNGVVSNVILDKYGRDVFSICIQWRCSRQEEEKEEYD